MKRVPQQKPRRAVSIRLLSALFLIFNPVNAAEGGYPPEVISRFIAACLGDDPLNTEREAYCRCTIAVLQSRLPYQRFSDWDRRAHAGESVAELEADLDTAREECGEHTVSFGSAEPRYRRLAVVGVDTW